MSYLSQMRFRPYPHQVPLFRHHLGEGLDEVRLGTSSSLMWHRRGGKDTCLLALLALAAQIKIGTYVHAMPEKQQIKQNVFVKVSARTGMTMYQFAVPQQWVASHSKTDLVVVFKNGSVIQFVGYDRPGGQLGGSLVGIVMSEYATSPYAEEAYETVYAPMLAETNGFRSYVSTPRGKNHFYGIHSDPKHIEDPLWLIDTQTIDMTKDHQGQPIITDEVARKFQARGDEGTLQQEYYCSVETPIRHAIYGRQWKHLVATGRYEPFGYRAYAPVVTAWDLGMSDETFIIFAQLHEGWLNIFDADYGSDKSLEVWVKEVLARDYTYAEHYGPHDIEVTEYCQSGEVPRSRRQIAAALGLHFTRLERAGLEDGIAATRVFFSRLRFNSASPGVERLVECIKSYRRHFDEAEEAQSTKPPGPKWATHGCDALRYLAQGFEPEALKLHVHDGRLYQPVGGRGIGSTVKLPGSLDQLDAGDDGLMQPGSYEIDLGYSLDQDEAW